MSESLWLSEGRLPLLVEPRPRRGGDRDRRAGLVDGPRVGAAAGGVGRRLVAVGVRAAAGLAAASAGGVRRRRRVRGDLQRPARRGAVRARGAARHGRAPVRAAGAGHLGDRHRGRLDHARDQADLQPAPLPAASRPAAGVRAAGRPDHRPCRGRLGASGEAGDARCGPSGGAGSSRRWWCSRRSAAVSLRYPELLGNGKGVVQAEALGGYSFGLLVRAAGAQAAGDDGLSGRRLAGRHVHADADDRGAAGRGARDDLESHLAGRPGRQLRGDRRRRVPGGRDAGTAVGGRADARADPQLRLADGPDAAGGRDRDRDLPPARRAVDLLRPAATRPRCAVGAVGGRGRDQHAGPVRRGAARRRRALHAAAVLETTNAGRTRGCDRRS